MTAPLRLTPDDVVLSHEGRRCWVDEIAPGSDARCPHCGVRLAVATDDVTTLSGSTNGPRASFGRIEVDMLITCDCGELIAARVDWDDL